MEGDPLRIFHQNQTRSDHQLCKVVWLYPHFLMALQVDPGLLQQLDRVWRVHVVAGPESEHYGAVEPSGGLTSR